jgi:hypothetical protein
MVRFLPEGDYNILAVKPLRAPLRLRNRGATSLPRAPDIPALARTSRARDHDRKTAAENARSTCSQEKCALLNRIGAICRLSSRWRRCVQGFHQKSAKSGRSGRERCTSYQAAPGGTQPGSMGRVLYVAMRCAGVASTLHRDIWARRLLAAGCGLPAGGEDLGSGVSVLLMGNQW